MFDFVNKYSQEAPHSSPMSVAYVGICEFEV